MAERNEEKQQECYTIEQISSKGKFSVTDACTGIRALAVKLERVTHQNESCRNYHFESLVCGMTRAS